MNIGIKKINDGNDEFLLAEKDKTILKVRYRRDLHTARVEAINERRILIIENEGLLRTKLVIKNEYGVLIGQMIFDNWSDSQGSVQIETIRYKFILEGSSPQELFIYKNSRKNLIYQCNLAFEPDNQTHVKDQVSVFIISIAWYLHLKALWEKKAELLIL